VGVQVIIAAVLGGRRTVVGAAMGAVFLIGMGELLRPLGELATLIVSVIALLVILFFPVGFLGFLRGRARSWARRCSRWAATPSASAATSRERT
jgi:branched-chain amino acid transport system permease protein